MSFRFEDSLPINAWQLAVSSASFGFQIAFAAIGVPPVVVALTHGSPFVGLICVATFSGLMFFLCLTAFYLRARQIVHTKPTVRIAESMVECLVDGEVVYRVDLAECHWRLSDSRFLSIFHPGLVVPRLSCIIISLPGGASKSSINVPIAFTESNRIAVGKHLRRIGVLQRPSVSPLSTARYIANGMYIAFLTAASFFSGIGLLSFFWNQAAVLLQPLSSFFMVIAHCCFAPGSFLIGAYLVSLWPWSAGLRSTNSFPGYRKHAKFLYQIIITGTSMFLVLFSGWNSVVSAGFQASVVGICAGVVLCMSIAILTSIFLGRRFSYWVVEP